MKISFAILLLTFVFFLRAQETPATPTTVETKVETKEVGLTPSPANKQTIRSSLDGLAQELEKSLDSGATACDAAETFITQLGTKPDYIKNHQATAFILEKLFVARKKLVFGYNTDKNFCNGKAKATYEKLEEIERQVYMSSKSVAQIGINGIKNIESAVYTSAPFTSRNFRGPKNFKLQSGDVVLFKKLNPSQDLVRWISPIDGGFDNSGIIFVDYSGVPMIITVSPLKGSLVTPFTSYILDQDNFSQEIIVLRPTNAAVGAKAATGMDDRIGLLSKQLGSNFYDTNYNLDDASNFFPAELIYRAYETVQPGFFSNIKKSTFPVSRTAPISLVVKSPTINMIFEKDFIFSGKFTLEGQWTFGAATRVNYLHYVWKYILQSPDKDLTKYTSIKSDVIKKLWSNRSNFFAEKTILAMGVDKKYFNYEKVEEFVVVSRFNKIMNQCSAEVQRKDFTRKIAEKKNWLSESEIENIFNACMRTVSFDF